MRGEDIDAHQDGLAVCTNLLNLHCHTRVQRTCVRLTHLRLHHGVDDALRVNHDVNVVVVRAKQVVGLNHLQALSKQGQRQRQWQWQWQADEERSAGRQAGTVVSTAY